MWDIFVHTQNGLAKSLTKRMTYLIDHYHRIAVNIMFASYSLTHRKLNSNLYNCNQNGTPCCNKYVEFWPQPIVPICVLVIFHTYQYHHRSIHPWALRIHIRYLSVIHKISWITQKGLIHSFTSPYANYILRKIPGIREKLIPHIENARNYKIIYEYYIQSSYPRIHK